MLYSETDDRLVFTVEKGSLTAPIDSIVDSVYSSIKAYQAAKLADKEKVKVDKLIQEISEVPSTQNDVGPAKTLHAEGELVHDDTYFLEMAAFEFQDTEFLVPKHRLLQKTDYLSSIFEVNSETPETPIRLPGVTAHDFRGLMKYLYPIESNGRLTTNDWISTLKLATKWKMISTREEAIEKLDSSGNLTGIMQVQLGNECKISQWVRTGYVSLVERQGHFTVAEVEAIGLQRASKLCELREQGYAEEWDTYLNRLTLEVHGTSNLISSHIPQSGEAYDQDDDLVQTILDAQRSGNRTLVLDAWGKMAKRTESLTSDEVERLTLPTAVKLWKIRLETRWAAWSLIQDIGIKYITTPADALRQVADSFEQELTNIEVDELAYAPFKQEKGKNVATPQQSTKTSQKNESELGGSKPAAKKTAASSTPAISTPEEAKPVKTKKAASLFGGFSAASSKPTTTDDSAGNAFVSLAKKTSSSLWDEPPATSPSSTFGFGGWGTSTMAAPAPVPAFEDVFSPVEEASTIPSIGEAPSVEISSTSSRKKSTTKFRK